MRIGWIVRAPLLLAREAHRGVNRGNCPVCDHRTVFVGGHDNYRENYRCLRCGSIPRWRAMALTLDRRVPHWKDGHIHESSPTGPFETKLRRGCRHYVRSHFFEERPLGSTTGGYRCEDLERQTFDDATFDVVITQDVLEHVPNAPQAFREIARTLKPGGVHLFTVPWDAKRGSVRRAVRRPDGSIDHILPPVYHGNPLSKDGSLVITDWGADLTTVIRETSGMDTARTTVHEPAHGVPEPVDVFVSTRRYPLPGDA